MYACIVHYSYIYLSSCQSWSKGSVPRNYPKFKCWTIFLGSIDAISPFIYSRMVGDPQSHTAAAFSAQRILRTVFGKTDAAKFLVQHSQVEARSSSKSWADDMLWLADESLPFQKQKNRDCWDMSHNIQSHCQANEDLSWTWQRRSAGHNWSNSAHLSDELKILEKKQLTNDGITWYNQLINTGNV